MPWKPSYASAAELQSWLGIPSTDPELDLAIAAASRAIDTATGRQFGTATATRFYTPDRGIVDIADTFDVDMVVLVDGAPIEYTPLPRNAPADGRPWTQLKVSVCGEVAVTAEFGWPEVPEAVVLATLIQAGRWFQRKGDVTGAPAGPLTSYTVDDVSVAWSVSAPQDLDADVLAAIAPYRKLWVAV